MRTTPYAGAVALVLGMATLSACGDDAASAGPDAGVRDAGARDAGARDAGEGEDAGDTDDGGAIRDASAMAEDCTLVIESESGAELAREALTCAAAAEQCRVKAGGACPCTSGKCAAALCEALTNDEPGALQDDAAFSCLVQWKKSVTDRFVYAHGDLISHEYGWLDVFIYDDAHHLLTSQGCSGDPESGICEFDDAGRLSVWAYAYGGAETILYLYDSNGRLSEKRSQDDGGGTACSQYVYDDAGSLTELRMGGLQTEDGVDAGGFGSEAEWLAHTTCEVSNCYAVTFDAEGNEVLTKKACSTP